MVAPLGLELIEKSLHGHERLRLQLEDAHARVIRNALVLEDACNQEQLEVATHRRRRHTGRVRELPRTVRPGADKLDDAAPRRIGERFKHIHSALIVHGNLN